MLVGKSLGRVKMPALPNEPVYLGDGLYAQYDGDQVELSAQNGIWKTDIVFLNGVVLSRFLDYLKTLGVERVS
jgi:hypothetical protein